MLEDAGASALGAAAGAVNAFNSDDKGDGVFADFDLVAWSTGTFVW